MLLSSSGSQTLSFMLPSSANSIALPVHATTGFSFLVDVSSVFTVFPALPQLSPSSFPALFPALPPSFPSSFPSSCPALAQLFPSSLPALSQLFPSSCPRCCARVARVVKTLSQTLPDSPRFSQTLPDSPRFSGSPRCSQTLPDSPRFCHILLRSPRLS